MMAGKADKATADTECQKLLGNIITPKSKDAQKRIEDYLNKKSFTDNIYLGIAKADGQWIWDDSKTTVFAERKFGKY